MHTRWLQQIDMAAILVVAPCALMRKGFFVLYFTYINVAVASVPGSGRVCTRWIDDIETRITHGGIGQCLLNGRINSRVRA